MARGIFRGDLRIASGCRPGTPAARPIAGSPAARVKAAVAHVYSRLKRVYPVPDRQIGSCREAAYESQTLDRQAMFGCESGALVWGWPIKQSHRGDGAA